MFTDNLHDWRPALTDQSPLTSFNSSISMAALSFQPEHCRRQQILGKEPSPLVSFQTVQVSSIPGTSPWVMRGTMVSYACHLAAPQERRHALLHICPATPRPLMKRMDQLGHETHMGKPAYFQILLRVCSNICSQHRNIFFKLFLQNYFELEFRIVR